MSKIDIYNIPGITKKDKEEYIKFETRWGNALAALYFAGLILFIVAILFTACEKEAQPEPEGLKFEYHYQINGLQLPAEFTISYIDSTGRYKEIVRKGVGCSLVEKYHSSGTQKIYLKVSTCQDVEIILWFTKNDTVKALTTGRRELTLTGSI